jgi:hypothetical protein
LFYDHALTFPTELRVIWRRPLGKGAWLFLLNRYIAFFGNLPNIVLEHFVILDEAGCRHYLLLRECVLLSSVLVIGCEYSSDTMLSRQLNISSHHGISHVCAVQPL